MEQVVMDQDQVRSWLPLRGRTEGGIPLFCFPHAGGGASAFRAWLNGISGADVLPLQPPARETRRREEPIMRVDALVECFADVVTAHTQGGPFAMYGHSLGALTAFETARELRRRGGPLPRHLVVSGSPAPQDSKHGRKVSTLPTPKLVKLLRKLGGTPSWMLDDPEMLAMVLPAVRADFAVREDYRYRAEEPLDVPITVIASTKDPRAPLRQQRHWTAQSAAASAVVEIPGDHFAVFDQDASVLPVLASAVSGRRFEATA